MVKNFVMIPHWIAEVYFRRKEPLGEVTNFSRARKILSMSDLAGLLAAQRVVPKDLLRVSDRHSWFFDETLRDAWMKTAITEEDKSFLENTIFVQYRDERFNKELTARLNSSVGEPQDTDNQDTQEPSMVYELTPSLGALIINQGFDSANPDHRVRAVRGMVKASYACTSINEVAASSRWYPVYLDRLFYSGQLASR